MACVGELSKPALLGISGKCIRWIIRSALINRWPILWGGVLSALLLSAATPASPVELPEAVAPPSAEAVSPSPVIEDGVYFYGQAVQPDQIGYGYLVFESQDDHLVGAVFSVNSSFDCFEGQISGGELVMQITHSYTQDSYRYAIAATLSNEPIASAGHTPLAPLELEGFFDLGAARTLELEILATCRADAGLKAELEI